MLMLEFWNNYKNEINDPNFTEDQEILGWMGVYTMKKYLAKTNFIVDKMIDLSKLEIFTNGMFEIGSLDNCFAIPGDECSSSEQRASVQLTYNDEPIYMRIGHNDYTNDWFVIIMGCWHHNKTWEDAKLSVEKGLKEYIEYINEEQ